MSLKVFAERDPYSSLIAKRIVDRAINLFHGDERNDSLQSIDSVLNLSMSNLEDLINELNDGPSFNEYFLRQDASIIQLNQDLQKIRDQLMASVRNMTSLENKQLNDFNITDQRMSFLNGRLDDIERRMFGIESNEGEDKDTVTFSESFGDLSFMDMDKTAAEKTPTLMDGYVTLPEQEVDERIDLSSASIKIDRLNRNRLEYPSETERPVSVAYEGRYYGYQNDINPEGGKWNIRIRQVSSKASEMDLLGLAHDASTYLQDNAQDLDDLLPKDAGVEPSGLASTNLGFPEGEIAQGRVAILDGNPETIWQMEYLIGLQPNENLSPEDITELESEVSALDRGTLEVALLIDLNRQVRTNGVRLNPFTSGNSEMTARLEIANADPSGLVFVDQVVPFSWTFPTQSIRYLRLTLTDSAVNLSPYPVSVVSFKRVITHLSESRVVPE